jgi:voltage-dependent potassium channel beta subunit
MLYTGAAVKNRRPCNKEHHMEYRKLGNTGLTVSEIAYGSWLTFADQIELDQARKIIARAFELGINYIDTADVYAYGEAESLLGEVLENYNRRHYVIATKAFWPMSAHKTDRGLSRKHIIDSVEGSLERLKLSSTDIFYCHRFDPETPLEETIEAIDDLIRLGRITYWGTSEWTAEQIRSAHALCSEHGWHRPVVNQPQYSLLKRNIEKDILPACVENGMGTANFSPLAHGLLTGKYSGGKVPEGSRGSHESQNMWIKDSLKDRSLLDTIDSLQEIADRYSLTIAQLSLAWILHNPGISSVIVGATSAEQLEQNTRASGIRISEEDYRKMSSLFPVQTR